MDNIKDYIKSLEIKDIPWNRMITAYGTAEKFPEFFAVLEKMQSVDDMNDALDNILSEVEHQDSLYQPLPFVMIFFKRLLKKTENIHTPESEWLAKEIQHTFEWILDACDYKVYEFPHGDPILDFAEMLEDKYLLPNYYYELCFEADYEHSIVYYTKRIIDGRFNSWAVKEDI
ncbi:MAG: hypothetical protein HDT23_01145 [Ruminococcus sp.]|nr:hypothetical protein [Ruminococcus sp.]